MKKCVLKKFFVLCCLAVIFTFTFGFGYNKLSVSEHAQEARTVSYTLEEAMNDDSYLEEFDTHTLDYTDSGVELSAEKKFSMEMLEGIDLVGLDENKETFTVRYDVSVIDDEEAVLLSVTIVGEDDITVIDTIPGLVTFNESGESDVLFVVDEDRVWLSDLTDGGLIDENGWFKSLIKSVCNAVVTATTAVVEAVVTVLSPILKPAVKAISNLTIRLFGKSGSAAISGVLLNMFKDESNIYHAKFDCWQAAFGYIDIYDIIFDGATSMDKRKFDFYDSNGDGLSDYMLWAWKGDYLALGAGAELGIYKKWAYCDQIWKVDKSLAMKMTLKLRYKPTDTYYINWAPEDKQWWITGFDYNHQYVSYWNLEATYTVSFDGLSYGISNAFNNKWNGNGWKLVDSTTRTYTFTF